MMLSPTALGATLALVATLASGCTTNPATGEQSFTGLTSTSEEVRIGRQNHPQIVREMGGAYPDEKLHKYVDSVGQLVARTTERRELSYTFTVLNSDIVNAFAIPGGYIYVTRGLLGLVSDEAELAAVLGHELGHITALHHAQRAGQGLLADILVTGLGVALGGEAAQGGQFLAQAALRGFSREHEHQSDELGIRYLSRVGFDTDAVPRFLSKLRAQSRLEAKLRGDSPDKVDQFNYLATHPAPIERVERAQAIAAGTRVANPMRGERVYLSQVDGMLYGDDPEQGIIKGRVFAHPKLRFRFEVPAGFRLFNSSDAVTAYGPGKSLIVFDRARRTSDGPVAYYLTNVWSAKRRLDDVETLTVNGLEAATGTTRLRTSTGDRDVRLLAIRVDLQTIYRFLFVTPPQETARLAAELRRTSYSFRRLDEREAAALKPLRIKVVTVGAGDTADSLAARMPFEDFRLERFQALNGLAPADRLRPGDQVKLVVE